LRRSRWIQQRRAAKNREEAQDLREKRDEERIERRVSESRPQSRDRTPPRKETRREEEKEPEVDDGVEKILTMEQRNEFIKAIISKIPIGRKELFAYPIKWDYLDRKVLETVETGAKKKLSEFVDDHEQLTGTLRFLLRLVKDRTVPEAMMKELVDALDEKEAEAVMIKVVRSIVYETEARAQGL
jgi:hypothetical protein